jgi:hypothetical protein
MKKSINRQESISVQFLKYADCLYCLFSATRRAWPRCVWRAALPKTSPLLFSETHAFGHMHRDRALEISCVAHPHPLCACVCLLLSLRLYLFLSMNRCLRSCWNSYTLRNAQLAAQFHKFDCSPETIKQCQFIFVDRRFHKTGHDNPNNPNSPKPVTTRSVAYPRPTNQQTNSVMQSVFCVCVLPQACLRRTCAGCCWTRALRWRCRTLSLFASSPGRTAVAQAR